MIVKIFKIIYFFKVVFISSKIMLYSGSGANPFCTQALENQLKDLSDDRVHSICRFENFNNLGNSREVKAIVVPGGNANQIYIHSGLQGREEEFKGKIDSSKISYYGSCAGAILASSGIYYGIPGPSGKVNVGFHSREQPFLGLFPGKVVAPLFPKSEGMEISLGDFNALDIRPSHSDEAIKSVHVMGPAFLYARRFFGTEVLATYTSPPDVTIIGELRGNVYITSKCVPPVEISESICHTRISGAPVLLTSSHPEIDSRVVRSEDFKEGLKITRDQQKELADKMQVDDENRKGLLKRYFGKIDIQCK